MYSNMQIFKYKDINLQNIVLCKPEKINDVYTSKISYKHENTTYDLSIQTPNDITYDGSNLCFSLVKKGNFFTFIEEVKDRIIEILYNNSENFFKGKKFSHDYIYQSVKNSIYIHDNGKAVVEDVTIQENCNIYDYFNDSLLDKPSLPYNGAFILKFSHIEFVKKSIKIYMEICAVKLSLEKPVIDTSFLEEPQEIEEQEPELEEVKKETGELSDVEFFS